jgi:hypothetical protein
MSVDARFRVFRIPYRRAGEALVREGKVECDVTIQAGYRAGELWSREDGQKVWVNVIVPYFEPPASAEEKARVDRLFGECEEQAERWLQENFPDRPLRYAGAEA